MKWLCGNGNAQQDETCLSFHAEFPDNYADRSPERRERECVLELDRCAIGGQEFYLRGNIEIPVTGNPDPFVLGVWALVSEDIYNEFAVSRDASLQEPVKGPYQGRIGNDITEIGKGTWMVRCTIEPRPPGQHPAFVVSKPTHPLAILQQCGVTMAEATKLAELFRPRPATVEAMS